MADDWTAWGPLVERYSTPGPRWQTGEKHLLVVSVGTGSAPVLGDTADGPSTNVVEAALNTLSALMSQAAADQDVNCRVIGRCTSGGIIDPHLGSFVP